MVQFSKGDFLWLEPAAKNRFSCPIGARVLQVNDDKIRVIDDFGQEQWLSVDHRYRLMHATSVQGVEDMISLGDLHEAAVLRNLYVRYNNKLIYTYIGSVLIAMNPYVQLPIYSTEQIRLYRNRRIGELPPHIFAIANSAYCNLKVNQHRDQCIVISGESGSGKTESAKLLVQFLATISGQHSWIEQQILEANPIMEAFGNAKTVRNDNSSRFGRNIELHFTGGNVGGGAVEGARIEPYLLEKSRIVAQAPNERNFHVFYCLLAGLSTAEKQRLFLGDVGEFYYLNQGGDPLTAEGRDDSADLAELRSSMKVLMFKEAEIWSIFKILAALLHVGNIKYIATTIDNSEVTEIKETLEIERVANLLRLDEQSLVNALTTRSVLTRDERIVSCLNAEQSLDTRDAFVKNIYHRLFLYVINRINEAVNVPRKEGALQSGSSISVLDIFGFENFPCNNFEQLCINYAGEMLQQFFVNYAFKMEQSEYDAEQINWGPIEIVDNREVLDLVALGPMNILSIIDEESVFRKGTDQTMLSKLHMHHGKKGLYFKPQSDLNKSFGITHYAGTVFYSSKGFVEKNRDKFSSDLLELLHGSKFRLLTVLFDDVYDYDDASMLRNRHPTIASHFRESLETLVANLMKKEPFFICCIKPNEIKRPLFVDRECVYKQVRYMGLLETVRIRRSGYPIRYRYEQFVERYRLLANGTGPSHKVDCCSASRRICDVVLGPEADIRLGRTKIFLKEAQNVLLEQEYDRILALRVTTIQKAVRGWIHRIQFERMKTAAVVIQKYWRGCIQRLRYRQIQIGFARLQAILRSRQIVLHYNLFRAIIVQFQARCRGTLIRNALRRKIERGEHCAAMMVSEDVLLSRCTSPCSTSTSVDGCDIAVIERLFGYLPANSIPPCGATAQNGCGSKQQQHRNEMKFSSYCSLVSDDGIGTVVSDNDLSAFQFGKFAATYFQMQNSSVYTRRPLRIALLHHDSDLDRTASLATWLVIQRFMGDAPEPAAASPSPPSPDPENVKYVPVMTKIYGIIGRDACKRRAKAESDYEQPFSSRKHYSPENMHLTLSPTVVAPPQHNDAVSMEILDRQLIQTKSSVEFYGYERYYGTFLDDSLVSNLDKLQFIIGHGILRPHLRDEIYCQICKQLTRNPSRSSCARGWILLSLCVGCFAPSERFRPYLQCFIRENCPTGATRFSAYIENKLKRTLVNGTRDHPPSYVEIQASKVKNPVSLGITFMDGTLEMVNADSATTSKEICDQLAATIGLKQSFGFSLYIAYFDKVISLGSGTDHLMDAICQCEQFAKETAKETVNPLWRLFYRKEIFSPWHDPNEDPVSTNLIYQQIIRGVKYGEYRSSKDEELAVLAAQQYYIDHGDAMNVEKLENSLVMYLPEDEIRDADENSNERWLQLVLHAFRKKFGQKHPTVEQVKADVVVFAKQKWPLLFSRYFEAFGYAGPSLPDDEVLIAVNWQGVAVVDDQDDVILQLPYPQISRITSTADNRSGVETLTFETIGSDEYCFESRNTKDVKELVDFFLAGLKSRSKYLLALQDSVDSGTDNESNAYLQFRRGDLLLLCDEYTGASLSKNQFVKGENATTGVQGLIPVNLVHILPTITKPSVETMDLFSRSQELDCPMNRQLALLTRHVMINREHTLEAFAADNFRSPPPQPQGLSENFYEHFAPPNLWSYSREPLKTPLLKKLQGKMEPSQAAVKGYLAILKYMGDYPCRRIFTITELTDKVFKGAFRYEILRDEIYCQLMKQLTYNYNLISLEHGWELMWLCTGIFPPSQSLLKEVELFFRTRTHPLAPHCFMRLRRIQRAGRRKFPPHDVEVEAVRQRTVQIFHKAFFPDNTDEIIEVDSTTKARDFCFRIAARLGLKSVDGFALFVKIGNKVISVPDSEFFFDFLRQLFEWMRPKNGTVFNFSYQVFFLKKLWLNTVPGEDRVADLIFHYPQELPKYLRGYHAVTRQQAVELAAVVLRARTRDDKAAPLSQLTQIISDIVPRDMIKSYSGADWKKQITSAYVGGYEHMPSSEAKMHFLKQIAEWPTFGSAFFEVKQSSDSAIPDKLLLAINKTGVHLYDPTSKQHIVHYPFTTLSSWNSGNTYFHMTVGSLMKGGRGARMLLETSLGYKIDDLLTSYIKQFISALNKPNAAAAGMIENEAAVM